MHSLIKMTAILVLSSLSSVTFANGGGIKPNPQMEVCSNDKNIGFTDWVSIPLPTPQPLGNGGGVWPSDKG